MGTGTIKFNYR